MSVINLRGLELDPERLWARMLQDAILSALPGYWIRRAEQFEAVGTSTCDALAVNCRRHAQLLSEDLSAGEGIVVDVACDVQAVAREVFGLQPDESQQARESGPE